MKHQWERQSPGDVRCVACGARALVPNDKDCAGEIDTTAKQAKPCCGEKVVSAAGAVTRPSCLECVEKHLGAAWVLLAETRDGYAHRLRAIGHLHEAEDESQEWPELHTAIREARKAYQREGAMPEFQRLAQSIAMLRLQSVTRA